MKRGWFSDSWRHSMAARGVKTSYMAKKSISGTFARSVLKAAKTPSGKRAAKIAAKGKAAAAKEARRPLTPSEQRYKQDLLRFASQNVKEQNVRTIEEAQNTYDFLRQLGVNKEVFLVNAVLPYYRNANSGVVNRVRVSELTPEEKKQQIIFWERQLRTYAAQRDAQREDFARRLLGRLKEGKTYEFVPETKEEEEMAIKLEKEAAAKNIRFSLPGDKNLKFIWQSDFKVPANVVEDFKNVASKSGVDLEEDN